MTDIGQSYIVQASRPPGLDNILKGCRPMKRKDSFNEVANLYDEGRPSYPDDLIEDIILKTNITPKDHLLEIGAGTGKATLQFGKRGFQVHCIEPGQKLVDILKTKCVDFPNISVDINSFEKWKAKPNQAYDLIFSASAFHWVDPKIKYKKTHMLLKDEGYLAVFWYGIDNTPDVLKKINTLIKSYRPKNLERKNYSSEELELKSSHYYDEVEVLKYPVENIIKVEEYIKSYSYFSVYFSVLEEDIKSKINLEIKKIIDQDGSSVSVQHNYTLLLAKKVKVGKRKWWLPI